MKYKSTRSDRSVQKTFKDVVMEGLAPDGGLYMPSVIPQVDIRTFNGKSYRDMAFAVFSQFISSDQIPSEDLKQIIDKSYSTFALEDVVRTVRVNDDDDLFVLELFHGPTFAFKDVALQFLGNVFEYFLDHSNSKQDYDLTQSSNSNGDVNRLTILGATSGDTGGAAIYGLRGKKNIECFILHPHQKISPIQEAQMTTVLDENIHNIAIGDGGTFDDCQDLVKQLFSDVEFNRSVNLGAVNSINWARIMAQITYYFHSYNELQSKYKQGLQNGLHDCKVSFVVPTGNFGDILAGFYALKMGLPVDRLVIATNANDILYRFFKTGKYEKQTALETYAPAMDIQISSNFERFLHHIVQEVIMQQNEKLESCDASDQASECIRGWMKQLKSDGRFSVFDHKYGEQILHLANKYFSVDTATDEDILRSIHSVYNNDGNYVLDPHTACAVHVARKLKLAKDVGSMVVCLATAHPVKFLSVVDKGINQKVDTAQQLHLQQQSQVSSLQSDRQSNELHSLTAQQQSWLTKEHCADAPFPIPEQFLGIMQKQKRVQLLPKNADKLKQFILSKVQGPIRN
ncbi:hypothetical protein MP228_001275 [Amoeboaphelidium protococcarum]|nr:hypothetical protein MP228_001275 [Amoeboaphelidium protococcarum]